MPFNMWSLIGCLNVGMPWPAGALGTFKGNVKEYSQSLYSITLCMDIMYFLE